jgi:phosphate transport system substrate-binding protein
MSLRWNKMEKKMMYLAVAVVAVIVIAAVGAAALMGNTGTKDEGTKIVLLKRTSTSQAYSPLDKEAVYNGSYPLARYLYLYTNGIPNGSVYAWLNWILTADKGQSHAEDAGYYALPTNILTVMRAQLDPTNHTGSNTGAVAEKGSDTMYELCVLWSQKFKNETGITVGIAGGGSGTGITAFIQKQVDIAQASRQMKQSEISQAIANGVNPVEWKVAMDGIAIIVEKSNPITVLTMDQLAKIYKGNFTNWNEVGGSNKDIVLYGRNSASGTYAYFQEVALANKPYASSMQQFAGNSQIVVQVTQNSGGIGYVGIGYAKQGQ